MDRQKKIGAVVLTLVTIGVIVGIIIGIVMTPPHDQRNQPKTADNGLSLYI